jgi:hypothetical protein
MMDYAHLPIQAPIPVRSSMGVAAVVINVIELQRDGSAV